jgi:hypothetical protein
VEPVRVTVLIEDLGSVAAAVPSSLRHPVIERVWARSESCDIPSLTANHLRFSLFGLDPAGPIPVAALTHVSDRQQRPDEHCYWLRADPVTLWADMARVFMTQFGFADLDPVERNEIENSIRRVLRREGIHLHSHHPERWCIPLEKPLDFSFTPLDEALGTDLAEALPEQPEARHWRRILTEIQIALHNAPVNIRRRANGQREINSVWFWGGGFMPDTTAHHPFDTVYSDDPVSRGLAIINDCRCVEQWEALTANLENDGPSVLVDWAVSGDGAEDELARMEALIELLHGRADHGFIDLELYDGSGRGRSYRKGAHRRFWRRRRPLSRILPARPDA